MRFILPGTPDDLQLETVQEVDGPDRDPEEEANSMRFAASGSLLVLDPLPCWILLPRRTGTNVETGQMSLIST